METFAGLGTKGLGTRMRHVLELLDGDVARVYADLGVPDYRPRYSPVVRALVALGPLSIRDLATAVGVTHSAVSQTAAQMARRGLLTLERGADARQRIARLTARARALLPLIEAEWAATDAAAAELEAELPAALTQVLQAAERAVLSRPMRTRIADAARTLARDAVPAGDDGAASVPSPERRAALLAIAGEAPGKSR